MALIPAGAVEMALLYKIYKLLFAPFLATANAFVADELAPKSKILSLPAGPAEPTKPSADTVKVVIPLAI